MYPAIPVGVTCDSSKCEASAFEHWTFISSVNCTVDDLHEDGTLASQICLDLNLTVNVFLELVR